MGAPIHRRLWRAWLRFGRWLGDHVARVALTAFYFTVALPFGLLVSLTQDPLDLRHRAGGWVSRAADNPTLDRARRLF
jgi:hypothetical protein